MNLQTEQEEMRKRWALLKGIKQIKKAKIMRQAKVAKGKNKNNRHIFINLDGVKEGVVRLSD